MMIRNKYEIKVFSSGYMRLVIFFLTLFAVMLYSFIDLYFIEKKAIKISIIVPIIFIIVFGGAAVFIYSLFASKLYIYGNKILVKKWYGLRKTYYVEEINKLVFEKSEGNIVSIQIISDITNDKYFDVKENFNELKKYLLMNVDKEKITCYILGTKEEVEI